MTTFKRELKGYWHFFLLEIFLLYQIFIEGETIPLFLWLDVAMSLIIAILLLRFATTFYIVVSQTELTINRDFFMSRHILIDEIKQVRFGNGWLPYAKIEMKNGENILFRDGYLSAKAKTTLLNLAEISK